MQCGNNSLLIANDYNHQTGDMENLGLQLFYMLESLLLRKSRILSALVLV